MTLLTLLVLLVFLASCASKRDVTSVSVTKPSKSKREVSLDRATVLEESVEEKQDRVIMVALDSASGDMTREIYQGAMVALKKLNDDSLRIVLSNDLEKDIEDKNPLAVFGPFSSTVAKNFRETKPYNLVSFAITNDSTAAGNGVFVTGITPEEQARFLAPQLTRVEKSDKKALKVMLEELGFDTTQAVAEFDFTNQGQAANSAKQEDAKRLSDLIGSIEWHIPKNHYLPIVVLGRQGDLFLDRFDKELRNSLAPLIDNNTFQAKLDVITNRLPADRQVWADTIGRILGYDRRRKDFQEKLDLAKPDIAKFFKDFELLDPPDVGAIVVVLHDEVDIRWLASLIAYYDNSWRKVPIFGLESWSKNDELFAERNLEGARIPRVAISRSVKGALDREFNRYFDQDPSNLSKVIYDLLVFVKQLDARPGSLTPEKITGVAGFNGWSGNYRIDQEGMIQAKMHLAEIAENRLGIARALSLTPYRAFGPTQ